MTKARTVLERLGFDPVRLRFTLRTAVAACLAVLIAWYAGLEHPQWSGMTVWAASLPIRSHLIEKGAFRALGTMLGAIFGMGLLLVSGGQTWIIVIGLALWIGLCAGTGNIVRGFFSYGFMLAGYSAAMVTLLHSTRSSDPLAVGIDRMLTVLLGVVVALAVGWVFAARSAPDELIERVRALSGRILHDLTRYLSGSGQPDRNEHQDLLSEMAGIEERLDQHAAGSLGSRAAIRAVRRLLLAEVGLLLWMRRGARLAASPDLVAALQEAESAAAESDRAQSVRAALQRAAGLSPDPMLAEALSGLAAAEKPVAEGDGPIEDGQSALALHRDWIGAREAWLRATFVILAVGVVWLASGWEGGGFMLLGSAIMVTIFSTFDNPTMTLRQVLLGQTLGVVGALLCRWLVWPLAENELGLVLLMMPFILAGAFLFGHRRTAPVGFDYNMVVLLLLQPAWPLTGSLGHSLMVGVAVILGPVVGLVGYHLIFPISGERRLRTLIAMMVGEIEAMARRRDGSRRHPVWRARLYHRVLRLVRWADKTGVRRREAVDGGFALLLTGSAVLHIDDLVQRPGLGPKEKWRLTATLARLRRLAHDPRRAARALAETANRLTDVPGIDTALLREAAAELSSTRAFIERAANLRGPVLSVSARPGVTG